MTTSARPLLRTLGLIGFTLLGAWLGLALFSTLWVGVVLCTILIAYLALVLGVWVIPCPDDPERPRKVFCIGLSRTGTTSLCVALHEMGYAVYHMPFKLLRWPDPHSTQARVDRRWADAFDAQADTPVALVYRELAEMYPEARFVLTTRDPAAWGASMASFYGRYATVFRYAPFIPVRRILRAAYGENWATRSPQEYAEVYERHVAEVRSFFARSGRNDRLLELAILDGEGWPELASHLGATPPAGVDFPRVDVFDLTWNLQPWWQLRSLLKRRVRAPGLSDP
jgi:hypothetical protein